MTDADIRRIHFAGFKKGGRGHQPRSAGGSGRWRRQGIGFSPGASRGTSPADTLTVAQGGPFWTSDPPEL